MKYLLLLSIFIFSLNSYSETPEIEAKESRYMAFLEKMKDHSKIAYESFQQKNIIKGCYSEGFVIALADGLLQEHMEKNNLTENQLEIVMEVFYSAYEVSPFCEGQNSDLNEMVALSLSIKELLSSASDTL